MKIFLKIFTITSLALLLSCEDEDIYNTDPGNANYDTYYTSLEEFEAAINGAYLSFFESGLYSESSGIIVVGDALADNLITNPDGRGTLLTGHNWLYNAGTGAPTGLYSTGYLMASRANAILDNADNLVDSLISEDDLALKNKIMAEARALRGIGHFEIAKSFLKIPTQSADANSFIGIAYMESFDPYATPSRLGTVQEVYTKIIADLEAAYAVLPATSSDNFRLSKRSLAGIMSRVYLYTGDYDKVIEYATPIVEDVDPAPKEDLLGLWRTQNSSGVLFETIVDASDPAIGINYSQGLNSSLIAEYTVDKAFYDLYESTESERRDASITYVSSLNIYAVRKYLQSVVQIGIHNGRYLRVEEVILNLAEAKYLSGDQAGALTTLNILRDARYSTYAGGETNDDLFNAIILERRKELAFEGDRFYTIKRLLGVNGIPSSYHQGFTRSGNGQFADGTGTASVSQTLSSDAREWQFPLGSNILIRNPNMTQTPGYN